MPVAAWRLCVVLFGIPWWGEPAWAEGRPRQEYEQWIKDVVSPNKPPPIKGGPPEAVFPRGYDFEAHKKVIYTWNRLNAEIEHALPVLLAHLHDEPYTFTAQNGKGCDYNYRVRDISRHIIRKHMRVWEYWVEAKPKLVGDKLALGPLVDWQGREFGSFDWEAHVKTTPKGRDPSLFALQVKAFDWAIRQQQRRPARDNNHNAVVLQCLRQRRDELVHAGHPILCYPWGDFQFADLHDGGKMRRQEKQAKTKVRKAMRAEVSRLASPNKRPKIVKGKVARFPKRYDRTAQERVLHSIRTLNNNLAAALPALVAGAKDNRYCVTLERPNGVQRNLTVGQVCSLLLATNVNVYRPYVRTLDEADSYPMYLKPTPSSIAKWWEKTSKSLIYRQITAFKWAQKFETERGGFRDTHERDVRLRYLTRRALEHRVYRVPIVVDLLKSERVLLPKG
jgi:hypothetical protein